MKTSDFDYFLPRHLIAQTPAKPRDSSKLMVYNSVSGKVRHKFFSDIKELLKPGDVLVVNTSKVIPARILFDGKEIFLLKEIKKNIYECLVRPGRKFKIGDKFSLSKGLKAKVNEVLKSGIRLIEFKSSKQSVHKELEKLGRVPLPPYIVNEKATMSQYQTVYANKKGSVAAPTAGLHFTKKLMSDLKRAGIQIEKVVLHVGLGTFLPVFSDTVEDHVMHSEEIELDAKTANRLNKAKKEGRRIIAVGTTSVRVLESCFKTGKGFVPQISDTSIFIYPGYKWKVVDALITNFHLPKSTLLMLVSSFLQQKGRKYPVKNLLNLYGKAKKNSYRFYSFGDAMFIF